MVAKFTTIMWVPLLSMALLGMSLAAGQDTGECSVTTVITETRPCGSPATIGTRTGTSTGTSTNAQGYIVEDQNRVQLNKHLEGWFCYYCNINL